MSNSSRARSATGKPRQKAKLPEAAPKLPEEPQVADAPTEETKAEVKPAPAPPTPDKPSLSLPPSRQQQSPDEYAVKQDEFSLWRIYRPEGGELPKTLQGSYTHKVEAERAVIVYINEE